MGNLQGSRAELDGIIVFVPRQGAHGQLEGSVADKVAVYGPGMVAREIPRGSHVKRYFLMIRLLSLGNGIVNHSLQRPVTFAQVVSAQVRKMAAYIPSLISCS